MNRGIRLQIFLASVLLFGIFAMLFAMASKSNRRWDLTDGKIYSLSNETQKLLDTLSEGKIELLAFYPHDDPSRVNFEMFLRECAAHHPRFHYRFYDPDRVPALARENQVKEYYTVVVKYEGRSQNVVGPTESNIAGALLKISSPRQLGICFVTGHGEAELQSEARRGLSVLRDGLAKMNYTTHEIILIRDQVPPFCDAVVLAGPRRDYDAGELEQLSAAFKAGRGILVLVDPMEIGGGQSFIDFLKKFGILLGEDVVVDKANRLVGGDFLVPKVAAYTKSHPVSSSLARPSIFPVMRTVQLTPETPEGFDPAVLFVTGQGSWAEKNLQALEKGDAQFEPALGDLAGPLSGGAAVEFPEKTPDKKILQGRLAAVGDSDFISNAYIGFSGNGDLALNLLQWLAKDDRFISIHPREPEFQPLYLTGQRKNYLLFGTVVAAPLFFLAAGSFWVLRRLR